MSATVYVCADQANGGAWNFTREELAELAAEFRPGSTVTGPFDHINAYEIGVPSEQGTMREVLYQANGMSFSFEDDDKIDLTAGLVFQILRRLAPDVPTLWISTTDSEPHPIQIAGRTEEDLLRELW